jgi:hypothetical protein
MEDSPATKRRKLVCKVVAVGLFTLTAARVDEFLFKFNVIRIS